MTTTTSNIARMQHLRRVSLGSSSMLTVKQHEKPKRRPGTTPRAGLNYRLPDFTKNLSAMKRKLYALGREFWIPLSASEDDHEVGYVKFIASKSPANYFVLEAVDTGIDSAESEKQGNKLEKLVKKRMSNVNEEKFFTTSAPALFLGLWYQLNGRLEEANACFRPFVTNAMQIVSDDDPDNDLEGLSALHLTLCMAGDDSNVIAMSYFMGVYKDDKDKEGDALIDLGCRSLPPGGGNPHSCGCHLESRQFNNQLPVSRA
jgi:hypothetical protein